MQERESGNICLCNCPFCLLNCTTHGAYLKALYAKEAEVLVQLSPGEGLLGPVEVFLQVCLHLLSAEGREGGREGGREEGREKK